MSKSVKRLPVNLWPASLPFPEFDNHDVGAGPFAVVIEKRHNELRPNNSPGSSWSLVKMLPDSLDEEQGLSLTHHLPCAKGGEGYEELDLPLPDTVARSLDGNGFPTLCTERDGGASRRCTCRPTGEDKGEDEVKLEVAARRLKLMMFGALIVATVVVALVFYSYATNKEHDAFDKKTFENALKVLESVGTSVHTTMGSLDVFGVAMTYFASMTNQTWPFVTVDSFEERATRFRALSQTLFLTLSPIVWAEHRQEWERYTAAHNNWVDESLKAELSNPSVSMYTDSNYTTYDKIHDAHQENDYDGSESTGVSANTGWAPRPSAARAYYVPGWQTSPLLPHLHHPVYNWDMLSLGDTASSLLEVIREGNPVFSKPALVPGYKDVDGVNVDLDAWDVLESDLESNDHREHAGKPASMIHYPIFGEASGTHNDPGHSPSRVVGFLSATIHFSELLANVLPKGSNGTVVVFDNPCSQSFTFELNGPEARYLGVGDRHDKKYESKVMAASLSDMGSYSSRSYAATWIPLSTEYCQFSIRVYPSQVVEQNFVTLYPVLFTVLIAFTFAVEIACFYWFTRIVERRQRNLLDIARERSRKLEDANIRLEHANHKVVESAALQLRHFACMSHEIRTPLNAILGMASVLIDMPLNPSQKEPVGIIVSSGDLLRSIVDDVLDYAKLESGNVDLTVKANSLQDVLSFVVSSVEAKVVAMPNRPRIRTFYDVNLPETVYTDSLRLRQILINLLSNVVKFSKQNGLVDLTVCSGPRDVQTRHADKDLPSSDGTSVSMIKFIVKDYGRGIRSENFQRIFQPFLQDTTEKGTGAAEGTGLGLAITKKLVERLGGSISVDSVFGEYSEFEVQLPCFLEDNGSEHARHAGTSFSCTKPSEFALPSNVTILCVDDDIQRCAHLTRVFDYYQVMYRCFHSMWEMEGALKGINSAASGDRLVCLCHIDMVESSVYERIAFEMPFLIMIAFGISTRSESVTEAPDHIPSLTKLLPAVMMRELGAAYNRSTQDTSGRSPSTKDLCDEPSIDSHCAAQCSVQSLRILIAEDNKVNQKVLCRILERLSVTDYEIVEDGRQAVDREAAKEFDVVLMDLQMPVMDGLEACRLICSRRPTDEATHPVACVVFLTASVSAAIKASCKEAGAIDFVSKPCNVSIVQECLEKVVSRSQRKPQKASGIDAGLLYPGEVAGVSTC